MQGIHRAVAFAVGDYPLVSHPELHGGVAVQHHAAVFVHLPCGFLQDHGHSVGGVVRPRQRVAGAMINSHAEGFQPEIRLFPACQPAHQQLHGSVSHFKVIAGVFQLLESVHDPAQHGLFHFNAELFGFEGYRGSARHFGHHEAGGVADLLRRDVLVGVVAPSQRARVQTGFVGESRSPHIGLLRIGSEIDQLRHLVRHAGEPLQPSFGQGLDAELEFQIGDDRDEIAVACPLAVAVDGALHLPGAAQHPGQGIGHAAARVVVEMNSYGGVEIVADGAHDFANLVRQRTAVGVAEHQPLCPGIGGSRQRLQSEFRVVEVAVEKVLGVEEHPQSLLAQICHRLRDHGETFFQRHSQGFRHMIIPALADNAHRRAVGRHEVGQSRVPFGFAIGPPGGAESHQSARFQIQVGLGLEEEFVVFGVGAGPAAFYEVDA